MPDFNRISTLLMLLAVTVVLVFVLAILFAPVAQAKCDTNCQAIIAKYGPADTSPHNTEYLGAKRILRESNRRFWEAGASPDPALLPSTTLERYYATDDSWAKRELARTPDYLRSKKND